MKKALKIIMWDKKNQKYTEILTVIVWLLHHIQGEGGTQTEIKMFWFLDFLGRKMGSFFNFIEDTESPLSRWIAVIGIAMAASCGAEYSKGSCCSSYKILVAAFCFANATLNFCCFDCCYIY
jgi:hypothetical protein